MSAYTSSMVLERSLNSQELPDAIPELQRERDRLKLLLDMTNALVSNLEPRDLLRAISSSIRQVMHCDLVGVWLPDVDPRYLRLRFLDFPESRGFAEEDSVYPIEGSTLGRVFRTGSPSVLGVTADALNEQEASK